MGSRSRRRPTGRKPRRKLLAGESEAYRELIERAADLREEIPELEVAETTEDQLRLYRQANEEIIRPYGRSHDRQSPA